ncbi:MAG: octopine/nopaline transport system permease protein [Pelagibacterales bacterium]|nr:octopine/nopaline transport system permease protein [Pelagibacterales bacterium]
MDLMIESFPKLINATILTIELTLLSLFFGIFVGIFFAILRTSKVKFFYFFSYYYSYIFRGTPLLVQIFIIYFGLAQIEWIRESFLWIFLKEPYSCAILAFTLNTGAYSSEIFRSAFETINKGVLEAAKSLGLNKINTFFKIKLPIAIKQSLPAYGNEMILMLKGTSLASTVTLLDLTGVAKHIISTTFRPIEIFILAGSIYLLFTFIIHNVIKFLEKKYDYNSVK